MRKRVVALLILACLAGGASSAAAQGDADIVVANASDKSNGDTSSVAALLAAAGSDGVSLREAIEATNNDPGTYTIAFAPALKGKTVTLAFDLPALEGGGVTIEGAGVTLGTTVKSSGSPCGRCGIEISSSGNTLHALTLKGFSVGVLIQPYRPPGNGPPPAHVTLAGNVVRGVVMRGISGFGIALVSVYSPTCGVPKPQPCHSFDSWTRTTIAGNTIESRATGIGAKLYNADDRIDHLTVTDNRIRISGEDAGISVAAGGDSTHAHISDVLVARNSITGEVGIGIDVSSGYQRAQSAVVERVQVLDNTLQLAQHRLPFCCQGIVVQAGSDSPEAIFPNARPLRYPDGNVMRNVLVRGNTVGGTIAWGVGVQAGNGAGGSGNRVSGVRVERNAIRFNADGAGVFVWAGQAGRPPYRNRIATGNRISGITIAANRIVVGGRARSSAPLSGGIALLSGSQWGRSNSVSCVRLAGNRITGPPLVVHSAPGNRASTGC